MLYPSRNEVLFKINDTIHFLSMDGNNISHSEISTSAVGWLRNYSERFLFIGEKRKLFCFDALAKARPYVQNDSLRNGYLERRERMKGDLAKALQLGAENSQALRFREKLLSEFKTLVIPLNEIFPIIVNNREKLRHPAWREFILKLQKRYGEEIITYRDIEIKFDTFLYESGLIEHFSAEKNKYFVKKDSGAADYKNYQASGDKSFLLPIKVIAGPELLKFFLLLNRNQLLCVYENGDILWERKVFYCPYPHISKHINWPTDRIRGRMYIDDIEAYLYNNVLIINDRINVIAVNIYDGSYIWSITNKGEIFDKEKRFPPDNLDLDDRLYKNCGIQKSFLKNVMFYSEFINDRLVIVHGNKVYSVNPTTGYCKAYTELNGIEGPIEVAASRENVYIVPYYLDNLKVLDKNLNLLGDFPLDFIADKETYPMLFFIGNYVILHLNSELYIVDRTNGKLKNKLSLGDAGMHFEEVFNNDLLVIFPFKRIVSYHFTDDAITVNWEVNLNPVDQNILWKYWEKASKYYFIIGKYILLPFREDGNYGMVFIDCETGNKLWQIYIGGARGFFYGLSNYGKVDGKINFILTTGCEEIFQKEFDFCSCAEGMFATSKICELSLANGETTIKEKRSIGTSRTVLKNNIVETKNYFVYALYGRLLKAERKTR